MASWDGPWLRQAQRAPSPHCDDRPADCSVDLLVLHAISLPPEDFGSGEVQRFFQGSLDFDHHPYYEQLRALRVSAHFFIEREGKIWQHVPVDRRAWHAGVSQWQGRERCNDFSVGIEIEGSATQPFAEAQYQALGQLIPALWSYFPGLDRRAIVGHSDIAPGRKWDPGPYFDWQRLWQEVAV
ncbi:1,6-anhydro-N-acetylmuramyl-L-alanine amidase AmpD [Candidatus Igneacidithiobacillus taiwanensis]|uniref:1,6-anhydro-N-acetylmuramyl-L-alanine amidase AmpD n=1 Tax=Candidatus Igneacidithiobacillus taiwanensis TaxID=1945924 RepID=UPI002897B8A9|nr:1,6-anhydro-N-acetylmuramyl-L-alanine amidase AmpD [Candidatus Igneacidithiobacillus taiwanensis]